MTVFNGFVGAARRLDDIDLPRMGHEIGVGEDELHAVIDVESRGKGFDTKRRPLILYEPHVAYRCASSKAKRDALVKAGLAYPTWGEKPYPKDSYARLLKAIEIDEAAALKACSWGMFQVLGENAESLGWPSVQAFVRDMMEDEENHLKAAIQFIKVNNLDDELRTLAALTRPTTAADCAPFVRTWNGPGYAKNNYHTKMAKAHNKWRKIKDTAWSPEEAPVPVPMPRPSLEPVVGRTDTVTVRVVQERLKELGYTEVGTPDGKLGKMTKTAILAFKNENDLKPINDIIDQAFLGSLDTAAPRDLPRETVAPEVVRKNAPEVRTNWLIKVGALVAGIPAAIGGLLDGVIGNLGFARETIKPLKEMFTDIPSEVWLIGVAVVAGGAYLVARQGEQKGIEAYQTGERR